MLKEVYVIHLADENGEFNWIYTYPKPYYPTKQEAEEIRKRLIKLDIAVTEDNCIVKKLYRIKSENQKNV